MEHKPGKARKNWFYLDAGEKRGGGGKQRELAALPGDGLLGKRWCRRGCKERGRFQAAKEKKRDGSR